MKGLLLRAIETQEKLEMIYLSNKGELTQRVILVERVGEESIRAFCYNRRQSRTFKLCNVLSIAPLRRNKKGA